MDHLRKKRFWKKDENGNQINYDGSLRKGIKTDKLYAKIEQEAISGHLKGSLGEDQESILI